MHDPKFDPGFGTAYLCEPAPSRHMVSSYMLLDLERLDRQFQGACKPPAFMTPRERLRFDNKGVAMAQGSFFRMLVDCAGGCVFGAQIGGNMPLMAWVNATTGWNLSDEDFLVLGERVEQLRHAFNVREGLNPARDFRPHPRGTGHPPMDRGPARGVSLPPDAMARPFYNALGWDLKTGMPAPQRMEALGLSDVMETLTNRLEPHKITVHVKIAGPIGGRSVIFSGMLTMRAGDSIEKLLKEADTFPETRSHRPFQKAFQQGAAPILLLNGERVDLSNKNKPALKDGDSVSVVVAIGGG
jgi:hypothetical protein